MTDQLKKDIIQWDIKSWSVALSYWDENIDWSKINNCLELGGHQGGLSLWLALKGKSVVCSDLENIKDNALKLHSAYNVTGLIKYQDINATAIPYENHFDLVVFKSIIGGIGRNDNTEIQEKVFKEIYKALKPGGKLLFAENLIASPLHKQMRKHFVKWGSSWRYVTIDEINFFLKDFKTVNIHTTGFLGTFGRNERQRYFLSSLDKLLFNKIVPASWKYIIYGIAEK